jgi:hypothetical protein
MKSFFDSKSYNDSNSYNDSWRVIMIQTVITIHEEL